MRSSDETLRILSSIVSNMLNTRYIGARHLQEKDMLKRIPSHSSIRSSEMRRLIRRCGLFLGKPSKNGFQRSIDPKRVADALDFITAVNEDRLEDARNVLDGCGRRA